MHGEAKILLKILMFKDIYSFVLFSLVLSARLAYNRDKVAGWWLSVRHNKAK
jgi:hypothetical protein